MAIVFWIVYALYLLAEAFIAYRFISTGNKLYLKSVLVSNVLFALYVAADEFFAIGVPHLLRLFVIAAMFIHTFIGYYKDRYTRSHKFDRYLHAYGCFAYALFLYSLLTRLIAAQVKPMLFEAIMVAFTGIAIGAIFELIEFLIDQKMPVKTQRGLIDTDVDLICDVIGSVLAGAASYIIVF